MWDLSRSGIKPPASAGGFFTILGHQGSPAPYLSNEQKSLKSDIGCYYRSQKLLIIVTEGRNLKTKQRQVGSICLCTCCFFLTVKTFCYFSSVSENRGELASRTRAMYSIQRTSWRLRVSYLPGSLTHLEPKGQVWKPFKDIYYF